jgi:hypothetical protein
MTRNVSKSIFGGNGTRPIYGQSHKQAPCTYTVPPELDINTYMLRTLNAITSITNKTTKDSALVRLTNVEADIRTIVQQI